MNKLEQARAQIDAIDREMAKLYEARLDAVKDVIAYKIENDLPILDSGREQVVMEKNLQFILFSLYQPHNCRLDVYQVRTS